MRGSCLRWFRILLPAALTVSVLAACAPDDPPAGDDGARARAVPATYVSDSACAACHPSEWDAWRGSHHDLAMQEATPESVLGDFDDARFRGDDTSALFFRRSDRFLVRIEAADGEPAEFVVRYVFGVHPLQQYLAEMDDGRLQALTVSWDVERERWFDLYPDDILAPGDPFHWTGAYQSWNGMCAECHSTNLQAGYDAATGVFQTTWSELDVGCQACHGPGGIHVERAAAGAGGGPDSGLVLALVGGDARQQIETCAPCHSRRRRVSAEDVTGEPFLDHFMPATLRQGLYHPDGQILDEVYVYGSFTQSKMYDRGVRCSDCHDPHGLGLQAEGNALCLQCHSPTPPTDRFPTLRSAEYDSPEHHHHEAGSDGAQCVSCHMVERIYMQIDPRRDHGFHIPRPDLTLDLGTPNACAGCHADRSTQWAADRVAEWYGPDRRAEPGFAPAFAAARRGDAGALPDLLSLAADPEQAAIVRATALELLEGYGPAAGDALRQALRDRDGMVRATAVAAMEVLPREVQIAEAGPLLTDSVRAVRLEAARLLASVPSDQLEPGQAMARGLALDEYRRAQRAMAHLPEGGFNLAVTWEEEGQVGRAEEGYRRSLEIDPGFLPARFNLANLYNRLGANPKAEQILRDGLARSPEIGDLHYSLGLLLAEEERILEAVAALERAIELMPERPRVRYNLALLLPGIGRASEAEAQLLRAHGISPADPEVVNALAVHYIKLRDWERALQFGEKLDRLVPNNPGVGRMLSQIRAALPGGS